MNDFILKLLEKLKKYRNDSVVPGKVTHMEIIEWLSEFLTEFKDFAIKATAKWTIKRIQKFWKRLKSKTKTKRE